MEASVPTKRKKKSKKTNDIIKVEKNNDNVPRENKSEDTGAANTGSAVDDGTDSTTHNHKNSAKKKVKSKRHEKESRVTMTLFENGSSGSERIKKKKKKSKHSETITIVPAGMENESPTTSGETESAEKNSMTTESIQAQLDSDAALTKPRKKKRSKQVKNMATDHFTSGKSPEHCNNTLDMSQLLESGCEAVKSKNRKKRKRENNGLADDDLRNKAKITKNGVENAAEESKTEKTNSSTGNLGATDGVSTIKRKSKKKKNKKKQNISCHSELSELVDIESQASDDSNITKQGKCATDEKGAENLSVEKKTKCKKSKKRKLLEEVSAISVNNCQTEHKKQLDTTSREPECTALRAVEPNSKGHSEQPSLVDEATSIKQNPKKKSGKYKNSNRTLTEGNGVKIDSQNEDKAMGTKKRKKSKPANESQGSQKLGQWETAEFEDSAQQEKFVQLLGGAKSSNQKRTSVGKSDGQSVLSRLSGVWKPPKGRTLFGSLQQKNKNTISSMALDAKESQQLASCLESQFTKTLEFNLQKRKEGNAAKGLGFQEDPAKGKRHYIDINKVNSIALD